VRDGADQIRVWKDAEASADCEHPAGEIDLPVTKGQIARTMVLAGLAVGFSSLGVAGTAGMPTITTGP
jgi:hypothetical protein